MAGNPTKPGPGRPKGAPNKVTATAKEVIQFAAQGLGGGPGLLAWAQKDDKNAAIFWGSIYPKLVPHQVTGEGGGPVTWQVVNFGPPPNTK